MNEQNKESMSDKEGVEETKKQDAIDSINRITSELMSIVVNEEKKEQHVLSIVHNKGKVSESVGMSEANNLQSGSDLMSIVVQCETVCEKVCEKVRQKTKHVFGFFCRYRPHMAS